VYITGQWRGRGFHKETGKIGGRSGDVTWGVVERKFGTEVRGQYWHQGLIGILTSGAIHTKGGKEDKKVFLSENAVWDLMAVNDTTVGGPERLDFHTTLVPIKSPTTQRGGTLEHAIPSSVCYFSRV